MHPHNHAAAALLSVMLTTQTPCLGRYVQLFEGGFQVVYPLGLWSRSPSELSKSYTDMASKLFTFTFTFTGRGQAPQHDL